MRSAAFLGSVASRASSRLAGAFPTCTSAPIPTATGAGHSMSWMPASETARMYSSVDLAFEDVHTCGRHTRSRLDTAARVGREKGDRIARFRLDDSRHEDHAPRRALVEPLLVMLCDSDRSRSPHGAGRGGSRRDGRTAHVRLLARHPRGADTNRIRQDRHRAPCSGSNPPGTGWRGLSAPQKTVESSCWQVWVGQTARATGAQCLHLYAWQRCWLSPPPGHNPPRRPAGVGPT